MEGQKGKRRRERSKADEDPRMEREGEIVAENEGMADERVN